MITTILTKFGLPIIILLAGFTGGMITNQRIQKPVDYKCPDCICPKQDPCNGIDFDKIKSRNLTIQNTQYLTIKGDSLLLSEIKKALKCK